MRSSEEWINVECLGASKSGGFVFRAGEWLLAVRGQWSGRHPPTSHKFQILVKVEQKRSPLDTTCGKSLTGEAHSRSTANEAVADEREGRVYRTQPVVDN